MTDPTAQTDRPEPPRSDRPRLIVVTGLSGAGRKTALHVLEDMGFETIDNMPLHLLPRLLDGPQARPLALGLDVRNRDFSAPAVLEVLDRLDSDGTPADLMFLDARPDVLARRFSETRRRHPLAPAEGIEVGIARELDLLPKLRNRADILIDTSELSVHELKATLHRRLGEEGPARLAVTVQSFSYKRGMPRGLDMVFDVRFLRNPYWDPKLRQGTGMDADVQDYVSADARFAPFFSQVQGLCELLLPAYAEEGKAHLAIGFGCTGGRHRSVTLAEKLGATLAEAGWQVSIRHIEQTRSAAGEQRA